MSEQSNLIQKLVLEEMPVTRSQTTLSRRGEGHREADQARHDPIGRPRASSPRPPQAHLGASRGRSRQDARATFPKGSIIEAQKFRRTVDQSGEYFAIELNPCSVRLYDPRFTDRPVHCTCEVFRDMQRPCEHLKGLCRSLMHKLEDEPSTAFQPPQSQIIQKISSLFPLIDRYQANLHEDFNQQLDTASLGLEERGEIICDMLSTFTEGLLPEEAQHKFALSTSLPAVEDSLHRDHLETTIYNIAMVDLEVFDALYKTIPLGYRVQCFLRKVSYTADVTLARFDSSHPMKFKPAPRCGEELWALVRQLKAYCLGRMAEPFSLREGQEASNLLIRLIESVLDRNRDLRQGGGPRAANNIHNLYTFLIGAPSSTAEIFGLDALGSLNFSYWAHLIHKLEEIRGRVQAQARKPSEPGSKEFALEVDRLLQREVAPA